MSRILQLGQLGLRRIGDDGVAPPVNTDAFETDTIADYTLFGSWSIGGGYLDHTAFTAATCRRTGVSYVNGSVIATITQAGNAGLVGRWQTNDLYYLAVVRDASSTSGAPNSIALYRRNSSYLLLGSSTVAFTRDTPHEMELRMNGTTIEVYFDSVLKVSATNSDIAAAGGVGAWGDTLPNRFDSLTWS